MPVSRSVHRVGAGTAPRSPESVKAPPVSFDIERARESLERRYGLYGVTQTKAGLYVEVDARQGSKHRKPSFVGLRTDWASTRGYVPAEPDAYGIVSDPATRSTQKAIDAAARMLRMAQKVQHRKNKNGLSDSRPRSKPIVSRADIEARDRRASVRERAERIAAIVRHNQSQGVTFSPDEG